MDDELLLGLLGATRCLIDVLDDDVVFVVVALVVDVVHNDCVDDKDLVGLLGGIRCLLNVLGDFF